MAIKTGYKVKHHAVLKDAMRIAGPGSGASDEYAQGLVHGVVAAVMACKGLDFEKALATAKEHSFEGRDWLHDVHEPWRDDWARLGVRFYR